MPESMKALAHSIMMQFGTGLGEPTEAQLRAILRDIEAVKRAGRSPTQDDWRDAVQRHCPTAGKYIYEGVDNSDLNALLFQAIQAVGKK